MAPIRTRSPCRSPERAQLPAGSIKFLHPGYQSPFNVLFSLPRVEESDSGWGVHHLTALLACQIIANNESSGFLARERTGANPVDANDLDAVLTEDKYFFCVPNKGCYDIVPSFEDWCFPATLPPAWTAAANAEVPDAAPTAGCIVSGRSTTESAHVVPRKNGEWFLTNAMARFAELATTNIDSPYNKLPLNPTLHYLFDSRVWAFGPRNGRYAVQAIAFVPEIGDREVLCEFVAAYHSRPLRAAPQVPTQYLYARFAWAVLLLVKGFVTNTLQDLGVVRYRVWEPGAVPRSRTDKLSWKERAGSYSRGGTSRKHSQMHEENDSLDDDSLGSWDDGSLVLWAGDEGKRGRSRAVKRVLGSWTDRHVDDGEDGAPDTQGMCRDLSATSSDSSLSESSSLVTPPLLPVSLPIVSQVK